MMMSLPFSTEEPLFAVVATRVIWLETNGGAAFAAPCKGDSEEGSGSMLAAANATQSKEANAKQQEN